MIVGTYTGRVVKLRRNTALLRYDEAGNILAQFDDMQIMHKNAHLGFGWHSFHKSDFKIRKENI
jgi:hypothetical protein